MCLCFILPLLVQESSSDIVSSFVLLMAVNFTFGGHLPRKTLSTALLNVHIQLLSKGSSMNQL